MEQLDFLKENSFKFKKKFGQNFLKDANILRKIVSLSKIEKETLVIEIGCGAGALTKEILKETNKYIGYEIDETLKPILESINQNIIFDDFLKRDVIKDINQFNYNELYLIANLPYYITTPIITKVIENQMNVDKMVIMVQKEVGERFMANPNSKEYNSLTIYLNYYFNVYKLFDVNRNAFVPKPNVDSVVLCFEKRKEKYCPKDEKLFFRLVKDSFVQKRKTLKNNLKNYDFDKIVEILKNHGFKDTVRAEQIPIEIFVEISNNI